MIKEYDDYLSQMQEKYPELTKQQLKEIVRYGFGKMFKIQGSWSMFSFKKDNKMFSFGNKKNTNKLKIKKFRRVYELKNKPFEYKYYLIYAPKEANALLRSLRKSDVKFIRLKDKLGYRVKEEAIYKAYPGDTIYEMFYQVDMGNCHRFSGNIPKEFFKLLKQK